MQKVNCNFLEVGLEDISCLLLGLQCTARALCHRALPSPLQAVCCLGSSGHWAGVGKFRTSGLGKPGTLLFLSSFFKIEVQLIHGMGKTNIFNIFKVLENK